MKWFVYILECGNKSLYTGMTNDLEKRIEAHRRGKGGKYTRSFKVKKLIYSEKCASRGAALRREAEIKSWPRLQKLEWVKRLK